MDRGRLREDVAALVYRAMWPDNDPAVPWEHIENVMAKEPILAAADAILKLIEDSRAPVSGALGEVGEGSSGASVPCAKEHTPDQHFAGGAAERYALGLLTEEAGEVSQLVGKALRFGIDTPGVKDPLTGHVDMSVTPRTNLEKELGDVVAAIDYAGRVGLIRREAVSQRAVEKLNRLVDPEAKDNLGRRLAPPAECASALAAARERDSAETGLRSGDSSRSGMNPESTEGDLQKMQTTPPQPQEEWRDISTAPGSGVPFWAYQRGREQFVCWEQDARDGPVWMDEADSEPEPTHWRPLPAPPPSADIRGEG